MDRGKRTAMGDADDGGGSGWRAGERLRATVQPAAGGAGAAGLMVRRPAAPRAGTQAETYAGWRGAGGNRQRQEQRLQCDRIGRNQGDHAPLKGRLAHNSKLMHGRRPLATLAGARKGSIETPNPPC